MRFAGHRSRYGRPFAQLEVNDVQYESHTRHNGLAPARLTEPSRLVYVGTVHVR
jgi:hypothetical protein